MAYGNSYKERLDAIPGQTYAPPREVLPSTKAILAQGSDAALQAGREPYVSKFSPKGDKARGLVAAPQQYYGSEADIMQSEVIRNTNADPFATRTAVQNARLQDGRKLNLEYAGQAGNLTNIEATSSLPSGKANIFSGSSAPMTPAQQAIESARVAEGQRVAGMYTQQAAAIPSGAQQQAPAGFDPATDVIGGSGEGWAGLLSAGIKAKQQRQAADFGEKVAGRKSLEARSAAEQAIQMRGQDLSAQTARSGREKSPEELAQIKAQTDLYGTQKTGLELGQREAQKVAALEEGLKALPEGDPRRTKVMQELQSLRRQAEESKIRQIQAQAQARVVAEQAAYGGGA